MKPKLPNQLRKKQFIGLIVFGVFIFIFQLFFQYYKKHQVTKTPDVQFITDSQNNTPLALSEFNPNDLDDKQWQHLGFSEKQAATILKYRQVVGGKFTSKEQLQKCYAISPEKFEQIKSYILLPKTNAEAQSGKFDLKKFENKELVINGKFNPDQYSTNDWQKMGFTEGQANAISKYKAFLGGSFVSKEKFKECFMISEENYKKLSPYLILPEKTPENYHHRAKNSFEKPQIQYHDFDPNILDVEGWKGLGFSEKQAKVIVKYRDRNLKGSFKNLEDLQNCFVISTEKFEELKPFVKINPESVSKIEEQKIEAKKAEPKTDFSKIDLNQITYHQLLEFGFDKKSSAMILSFRKKLGGFVNKKQIVETYDIDKNLAQKLASTAFLNSSNVSKYTLVDAPEDWLKSHPYFKFSADKIIYYRNSNPDEKKIWKFLKLKPEYEAKMRLYLK